MMWPLKMCLFEQYAVEACSLSKRGPMKVCDGIDILHRLL
jgi:hypothetical protein